LLGKIIFEQVATRIPQSVCLKIQTWFTLGPFVLLVCNGYTNSWRKLPAFQVFLLVVCHLFGLSAAHHKICLFFPALTHSAIANSVHFSSPALRALLFYSQPGNFLLFLSIAKSRDPVTTLPQIPLPQALTIRSCVFLNQASEFSHFALDIVAVFAASCLGNSSAFSACFLFWQNETFQRSPFAPRTSPQAPVSGAAFCIFGRYEGRKFNLKVVIVNAVVLPVLVVLGDVTENI